MHLCKVDPAMRRIVRRVGACTLVPRPRREYFVTLCKSIYTQQISTRIATILVDDTHDLIHKAVGWMLREVGKRSSETALTSFLERHAATMPRTMLRYAIERRPATERRRWMSLATKDAKS